MSTQLDIHLRKIDNKVSIDDEDRKPYTEVYDSIREYVLNSMCQADPVFKRLYKGYNLFGKFADAIHSLIVTAIRYERNYRQLHAQRALNKTQ